jgi:hypothetical protein
MLWIAGKFAGPPGDERRKPLVAAACECVRLSLHLVTAGEDRPRVAIEIAEAWTRGEATLEQVRAAARAAADAADAAYAAYAAAAAARAAYASSYAAAAADAAYAAAAYIAAASSSSSYAAAADASNDTLRRCADIVRLHYPAPPRLPSRAEIAQRNEARP